MENKIDKTAEIALCVVGRVIRFDGFLPIASENGMFSISELGKWDFSQTKIPNVLKAYGFSFEENYVYYSLKINNVRPFDGDRPNCGLLFLLKVRRNLVLVNPLTILNKSFEMFEGRYLDFDGNRYSFKSNPHLDDKKNDVVTEPLKVREFDDITTTFNTKDVMSLTGNVGVVSIPQGTEKDFFKNLKCRDGYKGFKEMEVDFACANDVSTGHNDNQNGTGKFSLGTSDAETEKTTKITQPMQTPNSAISEKEPSVGAPSQTSSSAVNRNILYIAAAACFILGLVLSWILYPVINPQEQTVKAKTYRERLVEFTTPGNMENAQKELNILSSDLQIANMFFYPFNHVKNADSSAIKHFKDTVKIPDWNGLVQASDTIRKMVKQEDPTVTVTVTDSDTQKDFIYSNMKNKKFDALKGIVDDKTLRILKKYSAVYSMETTYNSEGVSVNIDSPELIKHKVTDICELELRKGINPYMRNYTSISTSEVNGFISSKYNDEIACLNAKNIINKIFPKEVNQDNQKRFYKNVLSTYTLHDNGLDQMVTGFSSWQEVVRASKGTRK